MSAPAIDTRAFNGMCRSLASMSAVSYKAVVQAEVGKVLERALFYTPSAKAAPAITRWATALFSAQPASLYTPQSASGIRYRATQARRVGGGKLRYFLMNRYPSALYVAIENRRLASLKRRLAAAGLAKQSWLWLARQLGVEIKAPSFVAKAIAVTGKTYPENTSVRVLESPEKVQIDLTNAQPTVNIPQVGGRRAFAAAIAGRVKFFERNVSLRVFNDMAKIARQYPGFKTFLPRAA